MLSVIFRAFLSLLIRSSPAWNRRSNEHVNTAQSMSCSMGIIIRYRRFDLNLWHFLLSCVFDLQTSSSLRYHFADFASVLHWYYLAGNYSAFKSPIGCLRISWESANWDMELRILSWFSTPCSTWEQTDPWEVEITASYRGDMILSSSTKNTRSSLLVKYHHQLYIPARVS